LCHPRQANWNREINLERRSLYALQDDARYIYLHGIDGASVVERRVSLTFRAMATDKVPLPPLELSAFM